jgi:hypothetical protein
MYKKYLILFLSILLIFTLMLTACGGNQEVENQANVETEEEANVEENEAEENEAEENEEEAEEAEEEEAVMEKEEVVFWIQDSPDIFGHMADLFNEQQDKYTVIVEVIEDIPTAYKTAIAAGGAEVPDLMISYNHSLGEFGPTWTVLDDYIANSGLDMAQYEPSVEPMLKYKDQIVALPTELSPLYMVCNQKMIDDTLGEGAEFPTTLEEMETWLAAMQITDEDGDIIQAGWSPMYPTWYHQLWGVFNNGTYFDENNQPVVTSEEWVEIYGKIKKWFYTDQEDSAKMLEFTAGFGDFAEPNDPWYSGQVACTLQGPWVYAGITQGWYEGEEYGVAAEDVIAYPFPNSAGVNTIFVELAFMAIPQQAQHIDGAWEFLFFTQTPEMLEYRAQAGDIATLLKDPSQEFVDSVTNPLLGTLPGMLAAADQVITYPETENWEAIESAFERVVDTAMSGGDVEAALAEAAINISLEE